MTAVHDSTADIADPLARRLGVVLPERLTGGGIERIHLVHAVVDVDDSVDVQRSTVLRQVGVVVGKPLQSELFDVVTGDLCESAVTLLVVVTAVGQPLRGLGVGVQQALRGDVRRRSGGRVRMRDCRHHPEHERAQPRGQSRGSNQFRFSKTHIARVSTIVNARTAVNSTAKVFIHGMVVG